jgi:hypothetical protein
MRSSHKNSNSNEEEARSVFPSFLSGSPSIAHTLSYQIMRYIVLGGFCPWVRGGCIACSRGRGGFQCGRDVYPSSHAQRTIGILQLPFSLASPVFWLFLASMLFGITLSLVHVCMLFET